MADLDVICPNCGKKGPNWADAPSKERILEALQSWECECGWVFAEKPYEKSTGTFEIIEKEVQKNSEEIIDPDDPKEPKTKIVKEQREIKITVNPSKKISEFIAGV